MTANQHTVGTEVREAAGTGGGDGDLYDRPELESVA